jgi:hypothetical protein
MVATIEQSKLCLREHSMHFDSVTWLEHDFLSQVKHANPIRQKFLGTDRTRLPDRGDFFTGMTHLPDSSKNHK